MNNPIRPITLTLSQDDQAAILIALWYFKVRDRDIAIKACALSTLPTNILSERFDEWVKYIPPSENNTIVFNLIKAISMNVSMSLHNQHYADTGELTTAPNINNLTLN
jgi:hypothetical protein